MTILNTSPIHRWLHFPDSWNVYDVSRVFCNLDLLKSDVIYDPFVGCGTTTVVAAMCGYNTISGDHDTLSALTTWTKLHPPSIYSLSVLKNILLSHPIGQIFRYFADGQLFQIIPDNLIQYALFILSSAILRSEWNVNKPVDFHSVQCSIQVLIDELNEDISSFSNNLQEHHVFEADFRSINRTLIKTSETSNLVMVTSPPFFQSNTNPTRLKLANILSNNFTTSNRAKTHYKLDKPGKYATHSIKSDDDYDRHILDYIRLIDAIVDHASQMNCRAIGIEMGAKYIQGTQLSFDEYLYQQLTTSGFVNVFQQSVSDCLEPTTIIFAKR